MSSVAVLIGTPDPDPRRIINSADCLKSYESGFHRQAKSYAHTWHEVWKSLIHHENPEQDTEDGNEQHG